MNYIKTVYCTIKFVCVWGGGGGGGGGGGYHDFKPRC